MTENTWRTASRISLTGMPGWGPTERVEAVHGDGRGLVRVETCPVDPAAGLDALADLHQAGVAVPGAHDTGLTPATVLGSDDGRTRTVTWTDNHGRRLEATTSYVLRDGRLVTVTTVVADGDPVVAAEATQIATSAEVVPTTAFTEETLPLRAGEVDLSAVVAAWSAGTTPAPADEHLMTTEESFAAARHFGVAMLPGADSSQWDRLDSAQRDLVASVAWRSLEARGAGEPGDLRDALEIAASHDFIVMVASRRGEDLGARWFAARADRLVCLRPAGPDRMALSTHPTGDLADLVLADHRGPGTTVSASAVYRSGGHVVGDEATWTGADTEESVRGALIRLVSGSRARSTS